MMPIALVQLVEVPIFVGVLLCRSPAVKLKFLSAVGYPTVGITYTFPLKQFQMFHTHWSIAYRPTPCISHTKPSVSKYSCAHRSIRRHRLESIKISEQVFFSAHARRGRDRK